MHYLLVWEAGVEGECCRQTHMLYSAFSFISWNHLREKNNHYMTVLKAKERGFRDLRRTKLGPGMGFVPPSKAPSSEEEDEFLDSHPSPLTHSENVITWPNFSATSHLWSWGNNSARLLEFLWGLTEIMSVKCLVHHPAQSKGRY